MQPCMFVLVLVLSVWFACGFIYINRLKRETRRLMETNNEDDE